jgi:hypothetical protein
MKSVSDLRERSLSVITKTKSPVSLRRRKQQRQSTTRNVRLTKILKEFLPSLQLQQTEKELS